MISEPNPPPDGRALTWAAEQLGVPPASAPEVCTTAFLRRLAEEDFVPPPRLRQAWQFAACGSSEGRPTLPWLDSASEEELGGRVEEFAGQFFNLPPEQRSAIWERLYVDARRWPRLETRLKQLEPGLAVEFTPLPALSVREAKLMQWIRELFPLPLDERAQRRREMLRDDVGNDIRPWQKAAKRLRRRQRAIAALAPDLLVPLATWSAQVQAALRNRKRRKPEGVKWWRPVFRSGPNIFKSAPWIPVAIVVVSGLIRTMLVTPNEQPSYNSPIYTPHAHDYLPPVEPWQINRPESPEVREGLEKAYELLKKNGEIPDRWRTLPEPSPSDKADPPAPEDPKIREMIEEQERKEERFWNRAAQPSPAPLPSNTRQAEPSLPPAQVPASPPGPNR